MPKNPDIKRVLLIGSGPINIGQACEFDYSGVQACRALREEGCEIILVNSNPATIMTDPELTDKTYIEPLDPGILKRIILKEKPDTVLPTMGGQTALNLSIFIYDFLLEQGIKVIGANRDSINKAEDRQLFADAMKNIGLKTPEAAVAKNMEEALSISQKMGFPAIVRPSFTLGGSGGGIAYNQEEFINICHRGFQASPIGRIQVDKSLIGWKEYELEVVRDRNDNCIIVCSIENIDPMGIHTGDSITVAPVQTLTDKEYQKMRDASLSVLREIGVETGGANVQFAVDPVTGEQVVVEMNPRVSRSSALASKATGFPIARVATKLALGYSLDELDNEITGGAIPSSFEPSIDYVVTKIPRFDFKKFPTTDDRLSTQMKSVGEVMGIGRNFTESIQKSLCSLDTGLCGFNSMIELSDATKDSKEEDDKLRRELKIAGPNRLLYIGDALRKGWTLEEVYNLSKVDMWFLAQIKLIIAMEEEVAAEDLSQITEERMYFYKRHGFSDLRIAQLMSSNPKIKEEVTEDAVRNKRHDLSVRPVYKKVDSCAAEYTAPTAYFYSTYEEECEAEPDGQDKVAIIGSGSNRIGQGIEFDYCCVHVAQAVRAANKQCIMINCNPETVSTDYDTSDKLYFEPLTAEHTLEIIHKEKNPPVLVQYGGQTPLKLAEPLHNNGAKMLGTGIEVIKLTEDREEFRKILQELSLKQASNNIVRNSEEALKAAPKIGYPLVVRPSFVLGGRAMQTVYNDEELGYYLKQALDDIGENAILLDKYLDNAIEIDVDAVCDGEDTFIGGIMQHIEEAGVHSGDSSSSLPAHSLSDAQLEELARQTKIMAKRLGVVGMINVQFAIKDGQVYVLEINPRASRSAPFVSKIIGMSLASLAARVSMGEKLVDILPAKVLTANKPLHDYYAIKEAVFPFSKFPGYDPILGPEMKSTGEVMGIGKSFEEAFYKASVAAGMNLQKIQQDIEDGKKLHAFISVRDSDKKNIAELAHRLLSLGFDIWATIGTAKSLAAAGIKHQVINKFNEGSPHIVDKIINQEIDIIINTTQGRTSIADSASIRTEAIRLNLCYTTTVSAADAIILALEKGKILDVYPLQDIHRSNPQLTT